MEKRFGFPKKRRLRTTSDYQAVRTQGRPVHGSLLLLGVLDRENGAPPRAGIIVSRKVGNSVVRSRVKRLLRELARHHLGDLRAGIDMVLVAKRGAAAANLQDFVQEWLRLAKRASILRESE